MQTYQTWFGFFFFKICYVPVFLHICEVGILQCSENDVGAPGTGVTGARDPLDMVTRNP